MGATAGSCKSPARQGFFQAIEEFGHALQSASIRIVVIIVIIQVDPLPSRVRAGISEATPLINFQMISLSSSSGAA